MIGATLATSNDPDALVAGEESALRADAADLESRADALELVASNLARRLVPTWEGGAADGYGLRRQALVVSHRGVARAHRMAADVLRQHAETLEWAKSRAGDAVAMWATGCTDAPLSHSVAARPRWAYMPQAGPVYWGSSADVGVLRQQQRAEAILADAMWRVEVSAAAAASALDRLSEGLPDGQWHTGNFLAGLAAWAGGVVEDAWAVCGLRMVVDFDGYRAAMGQHFEHLVDLYELGTTDPFAIPPILFDTQTLEDDPARWWGLQAPELALLAVGGGAAVKATRLARRTHASASIGSRAAGALPTSTTALARPPAPTWPVRPQLIVDRPQVEAKYKHAVDFGVETPRGAGGFSAFERALREFLERPETLSVWGEYRGSPVLLNYDPHSRLVVIQEPSGAFISGWRMTEAQLSNVVDRGRLGGG